MIVAVTIAIPSRANTPPPPPPKKKKKKKNWDFNVIRTYGLCVSASVLYPTEL